MGWPMAEVKPPVETLVVHLPRQKNNVLDTKKEAGVIEEKSTLTAFFTACEQYEDARNIVYSDMPQYFTFRNNLWHPRKRFGPNLPIGRLQLVHPMDHERFYMRLLLTCTKGPTSYEDLRTSCL